MNVLERAECLLDAGSSGNMNFTVVVRYRGVVEAPALEKALVTLQHEHLLLRSTVLWDGESCRFVPTAAPVPVQTLPWPGDRDPQGASQAWKPAAKAALRQRFSGGSDPLWGITWLKGDGQGELLLTFHHAIADGLSSMALVQRLFALLAAQGSATDPPPSPGWDALTPDLELAFPWPPQTATEITTLKDRQDGGLTTSYALSELSAPSTQGVQAWTRRRSLRLNATLHAAFLQALVAAGMLPPHTTACTVVNLRHRIEPALPWDLMRLLRVCVESPVAVDPAEPLEHLAVHLHGMLQGQLREGAPQQALHAISEALRDDPSPRTFWQRSWRQGGLITNLGRVPVDAHHGDLRLERLFFVANIEPIALPEHPLVVLGALGFQGRLSLSCLHIEQQLGEAG
ncbi:MAG: condensation domain-containing protein, partial [Cyanobacteriota bacterium]|nr:condensation domain-containing protein [Cyanobacteriota bacterium]